MVSLDKYGYEISRSMHEFLNIGSLYLGIFPGIDKVKDFLHTFDKDKANDEDKREWVAEGALRHQFFFNSRFRWTHQNTHPSEGFYFDKDSFVVPSVPHTVENTCVALEGTDFNTRPTVYDKCIIPSIDADYQINPTSGGHTLQSLFPSAKLPKGNAAWDAYTLAAFYEQDAYEASTIRPWWSSTVCDMVSNFADRSTNYYFLQLLFEEMPRKMYQMMGQYEDEGDIHNVCKNPSCHSLGSIWATWTPLGRFVDAVDGHDCNTCRKIKDGEFNSDTWRKRARFLSNIKSVLESLFDKNPY